MVKTQKKPPEIRGPCLTSTKYEDSIQRKLLLHKLTGRSILSRPVIIVTSRTIRFVVVFQINMAIAAFKFAMDFIKL